MKIAMMGGGAWGTTLAQVLSDNKHEVTIYDINQNFVNKINETHLHPFFDLEIPHDIKATTDLKVALNGVEVVVLCIPTTYLRDALKKMNEFIDRKLLFINVSKGIEPESSKLVYELVDEEISFEHGYATISGPSHAEEVIERNVTALVSASFNPKYAKIAQELFANHNYLRVYTSNDVVGVESSGAIKNAFAIISGVAYGLGLKENARALLISRALKEFVSIVTTLGGNLQTVYGLSGLGDLIVTASSFNSRNFKCGINIAKGMPIDEAIKAVGQSVEGIRAIKASYQIGKKYGLELPMIDVAYKVVNGEIGPVEALSELLSRDLKNERYW